MTGGLASPHQPRWLPPRQLRRAAFWCYAVLLFVATHWPRLELPHVVIERTDIVVHMGAFGLWTLLLIASEYTGLWLSRTSIGRAWLIGIVYCAFDEATQAIPFIRRTAAWDDWAADVGGVTAAVVIALLLRARQSRRH